MQAGTEDNPEGRLRGRGFIPCQWCLLGKAWGKGAQWDKEPPLAFVPPCDPFASPPPPPDTQGSSLAGKGKQGKVKGFVLTCFTSQASGMGRVHEAWAGKGNRSWLCLVGGEIWFRKRAAYTR